MDSKETQVKSWVRPTTVWVMLAIPALNFVILPIVNTAITAFGLAVYQPVFPTLPQEIYWLMAAVFGTYSGFRSWDKKNVLMNGKNTTKK